MTWLNGAVNILFAFLGILRFRRSEPGGFPENSTLQNTHNGNHLFGFSFLIRAKAAIRGVLWKKVFLGIPQNSQENTCDRVSLFNKVAGLMHSYITPLDDYF